MIQKPYNLLLLTGLILFFVSLFLLKQNNSVDIHFYDTYFAIAHTHIFWMLTIFALFVWTLYLLTNKILYSKALIWTHIMITIFTLLLLALTHYFGDSFMSPTPRKYYDFSNWNLFENFTTFPKSIGITIFLLLFGQVIFIINFIAGLLKKLTYRKT